MLLFCIKHCGYDKSAMMKQRQKNYFKKRLILIYLRHLSVHLVKKTQHRPRERRQRTANTWLPFLREQIRDLKVWAKGVLVALFIKHVSGSNITFTKRKKKHKSKYISCVTEGNVILRRRQPFIKYMVSRAIAFKIVQKKKNKTKHETYKEKKLGLC